MVNGQREVWHELRKPEQDKRAKEKSLRSAEAFRTRGRDALEKSAETAALLYFTLAKMITRVYRAKDSISARPRISESWMPGRAAGFRARDSVAAAVARA